MQLAIGWSFPNAIKQYAVPALESVSIDMVEYTARRHRMYGALSDAGYEIATSGRPVPPVGPSAGWR